MKMASRCLFGESTSVVSRILDLLRGSQRLHKTERGIIRRLVPLLFPARLVLYLCHEL
jgi:hypothetical protein